MNNYIYKFFAPLVYFHTEELEIPLLKDAIIRKLSEKEKYILKEKYELECKHILECTITTEKETESISKLAISEGKKKIEDIITVLRLYKEAQIGFNSIFDEKYNLLVEINYYTTWVDPAVEFTEKKYEIEKKEINELKKLFTEIPFGKLKEFNVAIDYFNKSYIEPDCPRDPFIDLMISLESLYLKDGGQELAYKLALRGAYVIADASEKRKEIFKDLKLAYRKRGCIVHGEKEPIIPSDFFVKIRECTRESIKKIIKNPNLRGLDVNFRISNLDKRILEG